ncbi:MAG: hypothetical protein CMJ18_08040 [Phycisphaeraceae bacterium]|nr:hypothetical protein [Phycisphaeraceae bacterium]
MKRWEYRIIDSKDASGGVFRGPDRQKLEDHLNALGDEGWEIVGVDFLELDNRHSFLAIARREKPDGPVADATG